MPSKRESSARVDYVPALCTHRPSLLPIEWLSEAFGLAQGGWQRPPQSRKVGQTWSFRGSKSRNKVSVGEPAEGSLQRMPGLRSTRVIHNPVALCASLPRCICLRAGRLPVGHFKLLCNIAV